MTTPTNQTKNFYPLVNFIFKEFKRENFYSNRGNYSAAEFFSALLCKSLTRIEDILKMESLDHKNKHQVLLDIISNIKVSKISSYEINHSSKQNNFKNFIKDTKVLTRAAEATEEGPNLILRNYCYDQVSNVTFLDENDVVFGKLNKALCKVASNGLLYAGLNDLKYIPRFFGYKYEPIDRSILRYRKILNGLSGLSIPKNVGIYYRPETYPLQSQKLLTYVSSLKNCNVFILGALPGKDKNLDNFICTTDEKFFYSSIDTFYYTIPEEPGDTLPNCLVHAVLNGIQVNIVNAEKIIRPTDIYKTPLNSITAGFLELNLLFDFNHQFWDKRDQQALEQTKELLQNKLNDCIQYIYQTNNKSYYKNVLTILDFSPNRKNETIQEVAEHLIKISERYFVLELFSFLFKHYLMFSETEIETLKDILNELFPAENFNVFNGQSNDQEYRKLKRYLLEKYNKIYE